MKIKNYFSYRDPISNDLKCFLVYKFTCASCSSSYIGKIRGLKIPSISGLGTTFVLTTVENRIPSTSNLLKKTDYNAKISEIEKKFSDHKHDKYITTPEFNKITAGNFSVRLA